MAILRQDLTRVEDLPYLKQIGLLIADMEGQGILRERMLEFVFNPLTMLRIYKGVNDEGILNKMHETGELLGIRFRASPEVEHIRISIDYPNYPGFEPQEPQKEYGGTKWEVEE